VKEQYRMNPPLSKFPNARFYVGMLTDNAIIKEDRSGVKARIR